MKRAAKEAEQRTREERQLEKDERRRQEKEQGRRDKMEKNFQISESIKRKKEEDEEIMRRRMARQFEDNIRLAREIERKKDLERKEAMEKTRERARKTEEKRKATEGIFAKQRADVLARDALTRRRDALRVKKVKEANRIRAEEYKQRRDKAKERIEEVRRKGRASERTDGRLVGRLSSDKTNNVSSALTRRLKGQRRRSWF